MSSGGGKTDYVTGLVFGTEDQASLLQLTMYDRFLAPKEVRLKNVMVWFFERYLLDHVGIHGIGDFAQSRCAQ